MRIICAAYLNCIDYSFLGKELMAEEIVHGCVF